MSLYTSNKQLYTNNFCSIAHKATSTIKNESCKGKEVKTKKSPKWKRQ